jgi:hypothetical protein
VPGIAQKHGVGDFRANGDIWVFQNEIRDLGKTVLQHGIDRVQLQILLLDDFPYFPHMWKNYPTDERISPNVDNPVFDILIGVFRDMAGHFNLIHDTMGLHL